VKKNEKRTCQSFLFYKSAFWGLRINIVNLSVVNYANFALFIRLPVGTKSISCSLTDTGSVAHIPISL
jgi:hypothetical protein